MCIDHHQSLPDTVYITIRKHMYMYKGIVTISKSEVGSHKLCIPGHTGTSFSYIIFVQHFNIHLFFTVQNLYTI